VWRGISRIPGALVVIILALLLYVSTAGLPPWLAKKVAARINSGNVLMDYGLMRIMPLQMEFVVDDIRLYRKGVVGPPAIEAGRAVVGIDLGDLLAKRFCLKKVKVIDAVIRPKLCYGPKAAKQPPSGKFKAKFVIEMENCVVQGVNIATLSADLNIDGVVFCFENIGGTLKDRNTRGDLSGRVVYDDTARILTGHVLTQFDPKMMIPLMNEWGMTANVDFISRFEFPSRPPQCDITFCKLYYGDGDFSLDGSFNFQNGSYVGVNLASVTGKTHIDITSSNSIIKVHLADLVREEGRVNVVFTANLTRRLVTFDGTSDISPPAMLQMIGILTNECRQYFRFDGPVKVKAAGLADYGGLTNTNFRASIDAQKMAIGPIATETFLCNMEMLGHTNVLTDVRGGIHGGHYAGAAVIVAPSAMESNVSYKVDAIVREAGFKELIVSTFKEVDRNYSGKLSGWVKVSGLMGEGNGKTALGEGGVSVRKGRVFTLPLFGGLTEFMTKYIPGVDFLLAQTDAKADFVIGAGRAHSDEVLVEGDILSLHGSGEYFFDRRLDFEVQVKLLKKKTAVGKVIQFVTKPISDLFEFRLRGTLGKPQWSPRHL
jgi:hypothetical protein